MLHTVEHGARHIGHGFNLGQLDAFASACSQIKPFLSVRDVELSFGIVFPG